MLGSGMKGFFLATLSGLSEPVGALIAWAIVAACGEDMSPGTWKTCDEDFCLFSA